MWASLNCQLDPHIILYPTHLPRPRLAQNFLCVAFSLQAWHQFVPFTSGMSSIGYKHNTQMKGHDDSRSRMLLQDIKYCELHAFLFQVNRVMATHRSHLHRLLGSFATVLLVTFFPSPCSADSPPLKLVRRFCPNFSKSG